MADTEFADILSQAVAGNHAALEQIFELYMPLINKQSIVDGIFDDDCRQYILIQIALKISHFKM